MKKHALLGILVFAVVFAFLVAPVAGASSSTTFDEIVKSYEVIRLTLLNDSFEKLDEHAAAIRAAADASVKDEATAEEVRPLLPKIVSFADQLAEAEELEAARAAFYELSKTLVQYRSKVQGDDLPAVMYCPMSKRSWLQLEEEVGNPYYGKSMASCGSVVGK